MAGKGDVSFAVQVMSGLVSDVDTASAVLNHSSESLFRHINDNGIESLTDSGWLDNQLTILRACLGVLSRDKDYQISENHCGFSSAGQSTSVSNICTNLLDFLCRPVFDRVVAPGVSSDDSDRVVAGVLSLVVACFSFVTCEAQSKVSRMLVNLLSYKETAPFHLQVVRTLSQLYERHGDATFNHSDSDDLLAAIEGPCLTADESFVGQILVQLVPSILTHCDRRDEIIARLWSIVEKCYNNAHDGYVSRCCLLICGLTDIFFTPGVVSTSTAVNLLHSFVLWNCVQQGLQHSEALTRKRSVFLLRRALDFAGMIKSSAEVTTVESSSDLLNSVENLCQMSSVWHELIILFESLEEKQLSLYAFSRDADLVHKINL